MDEQMQPSQPQNVPDTSAVASGSIPQAAPLQVYESIAKSIIEAQEAVVGPIAVSRAQQVNGLSIDWPARTVHIDGDPIQVSDQLVKQYSILFGQISVEVCKEAAARYSTQVSGGALPSTLQK
jgi:hypothetical protein